MTIESDLALEAHKTPLQRIPGRPVNVSDFVERAFQHRPEKFVPLDSEAGKIMVAELENGSIAVHMETPLPDRTGQLFASVENRNGFDLLQPSTRVSQNASGQKPTSAPQHGRH